MAFKRKTDTGSGEQFKFETVGQKLTGYYIGSFDHDGEYGPTKKHVFKTPKGLKVVFGQTHLTQLLEGEKPGALMQVTYAEDKKMKKGNPMKMYTLDIDDEQVLDSDELPAAEDEANGNTEYTEEYSEEDEPAEEEEEAPEPDEVKTPPARAIAPPKTSSADAKARAAALMNKRRPSAKAS